MRGKAFLVLWCVGALVALPAHAAQELRYEGSSTIGMGLLEKGAVAAFTAKTGVRFASVENSGSGKGVEALLAGKVALAGASRPLSTEEKAKKLVGHVIGHDGIGVFVHNGNPVDNLTREQLQKIFTGEIRNWKAVGGKDAPISPNTEIQGEKRATLLEFQRLVMDGAAYGKGFKEVNLPRDQIFLLAGDEGGICTVSLGLGRSVRKELHGAVKAVMIDGVPPTEENIRSGRYPASRPLLLVTTERPDDAVRQFVDFMLSPAGQEIVAKEFVTLK